MPITFLLAGFVTVALISSSSPLSKLLTIKMTDWSFVYFLCLEMDFARQMPWFRWKVMLALLTPNNIFSTTMMPLSRSILDSWLLVKLTCLVCLYRLHTRRLQSAGLLSTQPKPSRLRRWTGEHSWRYRPASVRVGSRALSLSLTLAVSPSVSVTVEHEFTTGCLPATVDVIVSVDITWIDGISYTHTPEIWEFFSAMTWRDSKLESRKPEVKFGMILRYWMQVRVLRNICAWFTWPGELLIVLRHRCTT